MGTVSALKKEETIRYPEVNEAPRYSCALGGAYMAALATYGTVPILHSGAGCGMAQNFGQNFAAGLNGAGPQGNTSTPCSCLVEEHAVFGGEDKLRNLIKTSLEVMRGDLYAVISGCVPALIGDDVGAVVKEFRDRAPIIHVNTAGFLGNSYKGYEQYLDAVIDQLLTEQPRERKLVNILGVVPYQHVFWKGSLRVIKELLAKIGVEANIIFTEENGLESLRKIPAAELNLVFSPWSGVAAAKKLEERFGTSFAVFPTVPVGPKDTSAFLRSIGRLLKLREARVEEVIADEERRAYRFTEYMADIVMIALPHAYVGVVADTSTAIGLTRYGSNELGWIPEIVIITDNPPEESHEYIVRNLTDGLESAVKPRVVFETDSHRIRLLLQEHTLQLILASSLEKHIAVDELNAMQVSVAFPVYDRLIVDRTYAGYRGGLALMEDVAYKYGGPL